MSAHEFNEAKNADCAEFQNHLAELFESGQDPATYPHLATCENCSELVRDLQYIAAQAKLLMPIHDPSPAVWEKIHTAISEKHPSEK
jgi:hypothetical protein